MIMAVIGSKCSGKTTYAQYLVKNHNYILIDLRSSNDNLDEDIEEQKEISIINRISINSNSENDISNFKQNLSISSGTKIKCNLVHSDQIYNSDCNTSIRDAKEDSNKESSPEQINFSPKTDNNLIVHPKINKFILNKNSKKQIMKSKIREIRKDNPHSKIIILDVDKESLEELERKTFFRVIEISSSASNRYRNFKKKYNKPENFSAEKFLDLDELYLKTNCITSKEITMTIINNNTIEDLYTKISNVFIEFKIEERILWVDYFMSVAHEISKRSNCIKQRVGALVVRKNKIIAAGYNGTPFGIKNCFEGGCQRCLSDAEQGEGLDNCLCLHAEQNAILEVGFYKTQGSTLYSTSFPCNGCAKLITQAKIKQVVYSREYNSTLTREMFKEAGIEIVKYREYAKSI